MRPTRATHRWGPKASAVVFGVWLAGLVAGRAAAGEFPEYPQFRYVGGLPGNGWAIDAEGNAGWDGAISQAIPLGYTASDGSFGVAFHSGSIRGGPKLGLSGKDVNGMLAGTLGFGPRGHGASLTLNAVDRDFDMVIDLQGQILSETDSRPAVSVGVLDLLNAREAIIHVWPRGPKARSYFVAATKRFEAGGRPLHVTLGFGTDRFNDRPFAGVCYDVHRRIKLLAEHDGFNVNAGAAAQLLPERGARGVDEQKPSGRRDALVLFVGAADLERPVLGLSYARRDLF